MELVIEGPTQPSEGPRQLLTADRAGQGIVGDGAVQEQVTGQWEDVQVRPGGRGPRGRTGVGGGVARAKVLRQEGGTVGRRRSVKAWGKDQQPRSPGCVFSRAGSQDLSTWMLAEA